ncbi:MAG: Ig-like domain-containing protein [Aestuariivirga sp.]|nr:Ig-like domain-containing protein [Aestuariivirga sp.]
MWKPQPGKWLLWALPMVALPTLSAVWLNTSSLFRDISARSTEQLSAIGADWAVTTFDGRDASLGGDAPSQQAIDSAVNALAGVYGVRTVINGARVVAPLPVTLIAPRIKSLVSNSPTPEITGTWQEGAAKTLTVTLVGKAFNLGTDPELISNAGTWTLKPSAALADGNYDVTAGNSDGVNPVIGTTIPAKLVIDTVAPPAPAITPLASGIQWPFTLNGTWVEDGATSLTAKLANQTWTLGKDEDLKSDGKGNWSFAPVVDLRPGTYDVTMEASDEAGNISKSVLAAAIVIQELPAAPATPIPAPIEAIIAGPTLTSSTIMEARPALAGTWPEAAATGLSVSLAGRSYVLGTDAALSSDGAGNWKLKSESVLKDGAYDVAVETVNAGGERLAITSTIIVDAAAPASPTVSLYASDVTPSVITGTWAEGDATSLKVSIPAAVLEATLGGDGNNLVSDGQGNWSLAVPLTLEPGSYDVVVETADKVGRKSFDQTRFELNIKAPAAQESQQPAPARQPEPLAAQIPAPAEQPADSQPAASQPASPAYDCAAALAGISAAFPIRFAFNDTQLKPPLDAAMNQYAALLNDRRCATMRAEVAGHADFFGPRLSNQALSEARAQTVVSALVAAGVDAPRLSTHGFSYSMPADTEKSAAARQKNRRVEITLVK